MSNATPVATATDHKRIANLADLVRGIVAPFAIANSETKGATETLNDKRAEEGSIREDIMVSLAAFSLSETLTETEVSQVAAKVAAQHNNTETAKAMSTFIGECKRAMHPACRSQVPHLTALRDLCWISETEMKKADPECPTPLRDAFKRSYHLLLAMYGATGEGEANFATASDVATFAEEKLDAMRTDVKAVMKKIAKLTAELQGYYRTFSVDDLGAAIQSLNELDEKTLRRSLAAPKAATIPTLPVMTPPPPVAAPTPAPTVVENTPTPTPASDLIDDLLVTRLDFAA